MRLSELDLLLRIVDGTDVELLSNFTRSCPGSGPELQDPVIVVAEAAPTVAVAGGEPERALRWHLPVKIFA